MSRTPLFVSACVLGLASSVPGFAQDRDAATLAEATAVLQAFASDDEHGIPVELLERARGVAVIPNVIRGGLIVGARRGRGVLTVRSEDGGWSNPAFVKLTGGSIGWQIGAESADVVLVFANDRSVRNIANGKFTLGGDATALAGPMGRRSTAALTFKAEVYAYVMSHGLFAGATFEGTRLNVDRQAGRRFYSADGRAGPLGARGAATPPVAQGFLGALARAAVVAPEAGGAPAAEEAVIYPLDEAR